MNEMTLTLTDKMKYTFFPRRCIGCGALIAMTDVYCGDCDPEKQRITPPKCRRCGCNQKACKCKSMADVRFSQIVSPFYYDGTVESCIKLFKFQQYFGCGDYLAKEMIKVIEAEYDINEFSYITCVPTTRKRKQQRGFSQCEYLLKRIARSFGRKYYPNLLIKTRETPAQSTLKKTDRMTNLINAFTVNPAFDLSGKTVLLCDDIITTGATLNECTAALLRAGAQDVKCVTAAVTYRHERKVPEC